MRYLIIIILLISSGCLDRPETAKVNLSNTTDLERFDAHSLRIAVSSVLSPEETLVYYQEMFDYISENRHSC